MWPRSQRRNGRSHKKTGDLEYGDRRTRRGIMGGAYNEIWLSSSVLVLPMLALSITLLGLIFTRLMPDEQSSYSIDNSTAIELGNAYYVNFSATQLVFIASISSTLATVLIMPAMVLFSYVVAHHFARNSDLTRTANLPSSYQLGLIIKTLDARFSALFSFMSYAWGSKKNRIKVVPDLWKGIAMLFALVLLALLIALSDTWLHISTKSVDYLQIQSSTDPAVPFLPSRGISEQCLNASHSNYGQPFSTCNIQPSGSGGGGGLVNQSEYIRVSAGQSNMSAVYLANGLAVLGPASAPRGEDFQGSSFGSTTSCKMVTKECGTHQTDPGGSDAARDLAFACNATTAGLKLKGNFTDIYQSSARSSEEGSSSNTLSSQTGTGNYNMGFQYYNDSAKTQLSTANGPEDLGASTLYWAFVFALDAGFASSSYAENEPGDYNSQGSNLFNDLDLAGLPRAGLGGIMSCETRLLDVTYNYTSLPTPSLAIDRSSPLNTSAPLIFLGPLSNSYGFEQLHRGLNTAAATASSPDQLASSFASAYDQTIMAMPAGTFIQLPPLGTPTVRVTSQVSRVPRAPFLALVILDLIYATLGISLTIVALMVVARGDGVRDAQARLSVGAVVAESFESPLLGEDARNVGELFAERRGLGESARRIALGKRETSQGGEPMQLGKGVGGRRYRQVVWATRKGEGGGMAVI